MGPGEGATPDENTLAYELGAAIAKEKWITLSGGRAFGVMDSVLKGAKQNGGETIGILPGSTESGGSEYADIKIITGMNSARNIISILSSHVIVVCGMAPGTASEAALAIRADKRVVLLNQDDITIQFFKKLGSYKVNEADTVEHAIKLIRELLAVNH
jgi:Predicted Rossmann fold nucleotide-binding protein